MRTHEQLLQCAIGDPSYGVPKGYCASTRGPFTFFTIDLPSSFRYGIPPTWRFAILLRSSKSLTADDQRVILHTAHDIVKDTPAHDTAVPLVFLSDEPTIHLGNELSHNHSKVFCLDHHEIPARPKNALPPHFAPFMLAIRSKLKSSEVSGLMLSPYTRNKPASTWRFYGRRRELRQLVNSPENFAVIGARRIGKTSLLIETKRQLEGVGYRTFFVDLQSVETEAEMVSKILYELEARELEAAIRRQKALNEQLFESIIRRMKHFGSGSAIMIDELGNVITRMPKESWRILGVLRHFAQVGGVKLIFSAFQEYLFRQQDDFAGPLVNFATTLRLRGFTEAEVGDFVAGPLEIWGNLNASGTKSALLDLVSSAVGRHPHMLQHFCAGVFEMMLKEPAADVLTIARRVVSVDTLRVFNEVVEEMFYRMPSSILRYIFLAKCMESWQKGVAIKDTVIEDTWIQDEFKKLGFISTSGMRRRFLESLEVRGLTEPEGNNLGYQRVIVPIVFHTLTKSEPDLQKKLNQYQSEIGLELNKWQ